MDSGNEWYGGIFVNSSHCIDDTIIMMNQYNWSSRICIISERDSCYWATSARCPWLYYVCVCVCPLVFVSVLVNQSPFRQPLAADSTLSSAVCQVSFMLPVGVDDELVPRAFYVTMSFFHSDSRLIRTDIRYTSQHDSPVQMWTDGSLASFVSPPPPAAGTCADMG